MRYAILSDIHANEAALRAALVDAADLQAEKIVCLGDVLGYGPDPVATLERVYRAAHVCLAGNHDDAVANRCSTEDFTDFAAAAVKRQRALLSQSALDWLRHLPYTCAFPGFACAHGDFSDPKNFNYVLECAEAEPSWAACAEPLLFAGHTHKPAVFVRAADGTVSARPAEDFTVEPGLRYFVNVGSVGYPRSGTCRSSYCLYDDATRRVQFRSLPFDLEGYAAKMHGQGLDEAPWIAARAEARRRPAVRADERFGKKALPPVRKPAPAPVPVAPPPAPPPRAHGAAAIVAGALVLAGAFVWCTRAVLREGPDGAAQQALAAVAVPPEEAPVAPPVRFSEPQMLCADWRVSFEDAAAQRAKVAPNAQKGVTAFRLENARPAATRLEKRLALFEKPAKMRYGVRLLTPRRPGRKESFQFTLHLTLRDARGQILAEKYASGKRSAQGRLDVPSAAAEAHLAIDCRFAGAFDLEMPHFKPE